VPGASAHAYAELADQIAEAAAESCPGVDIRIGFLEGNSDLLADLLAAEPAESTESLEQPEPPRHPGPAAYPDAMLRPGPGIRPDEPEQGSHRANGTHRAGHSHRADSSAPAEGPGGVNGTGIVPQAVIVPLLAGAHPDFDRRVATILSQVPMQVMLAPHLGPHPLLAGALHDRLSEVGLARASRARGLNISIGSNGVLVIADRGPQAVADAGVTAVLLAARLAVPVIPASLGDVDSIRAAIERLAEAGATHPAIAPCLIGPETNPDELTHLSSALDAPCAAPLGAHPAIAQLVAVRYGEALARMSVRSH
jgi:sirohydrochlorin ferrochelatase